MLLTDGMHLEVEGSESLLSFRGHSEKHDALSYFRDKKCHSHTQPSA